MFRVMLALLWFVIASLILHAAPERPPIKPVAPMAKARFVPVLPVETNWGTIEQQGRNFRITGHPTWDGVGEIRADGTVYLLWRLLSTGEPAPSVYRITKGDNGNELHGFWNYAENCRVENGELKGLDRRDVIRRLPVPEPDQ